MFRIEAGVLADGKFIVSKKIKVRVVRDRLNYWFEPFSADLGWQTSKPEMRKDTNDYLCPQNTTYPRESLQSIYEFLKSEKSFNLPNNQGVKKVSWLKPNITCFSQFNNILRATNHNQLIDLNSIKRINLSAVLNLHTVENKMVALFCTQKMQTTFNPSDFNPEFGLPRITQLSSKVGIVQAVVSELKDNRLTNGCLLALWYKEGSLKFNAQNKNKHYVTWPAFTLNATSRPASEDDAKTVFIYDTCYIGLGLDDALLHLSGGVDNEPDLSDYTKALRCFINYVDITSGKVGTGKKITDYLTVTKVLDKSVVQDPTKPTYIYYVSASDKFYVELLKIVWKRFVSKWRQEGVDFTYMTYNMRNNSFNDLIKSVTQYPERQRLGWVHWSIHYEIRIGEYNEVRDNVQKFYFYHTIFDLLYP